MNSSAVFGLVLTLWAISTLSLRFEGPCDSCGKECQSACGTRGFRTCCLNYLKKRSTPVAGGPEKELEVMMVLPQLARYYPALRFLLPGSEDREAKRAENSAVEPLFLPSST